MHLIKVKEVIATALQRFGLKSPSIIGIQYKYNEVWEDFVFYLLLSPTANRKEQVLHEGVVLLHIVHT